MVDRHATHLANLPLALTFLFSAIQLRAADASNYLLFSKSPLLVRPRLAISAESTDNLFSQSEGQSDFITTLSPGVNIQFGRLAKNFVSLDYGFSQHFYLDRADLNSGEHSIGLRSRVQSGRFAFSGNDSVQSLDSPVGLVSEYRLQLAPIQPTPGPGGEIPIPPIGGEPPGTIQSPELIAGIADRSVARMSYADGYSLSFAISEKTGVYLQGQHSTTDYETGIGLYDINTLRATAGFGFQAFPKMGFFGETAYGQTATSPNFPAPKNPHVEFLGGAVGAKGAFTPKLSGTVKVGYESRKFSDNTPTPSSPVVDVSLGFRATVRSSYSLSFARLHDVSIQYGKESYTANVMSVQWDQALGSAQRWRTSLGGRFGFFDYQSPDNNAARQYDQYSAYFRLAYQIQLWLSANLGYAWDSIKTGSGGGSDYEINRISLGFAIGY